MIMEEVFIGNETESALEMLNKWNGNFGKESIISIQRLENGIDIIRVFYIKN